MLQAASRVLAMMIALQVSSVSAAALQVKEPPRREGQIQIKLWNPTDDDPSPHERRRVERLAERAAFALGLSQYDFPRGVSIGLLTVLPAGVDAIAYPESDSLVLRGQATSWVDERLLRVLRHEFAHIFLHKKFGRRSLPPWFREGFAGWASGGLDCGGEARIRLDVFMLSQKGVDLPSPFDEPNDFPSPHLADVYHTLFFSALNEFSDGKVGDGILLDAVADRGPRALENVTGLTLAELEKSWKAWLMKGYGSLDPSPRCGRAAPGR